MSKMHQKLQPHECLQDGHANTVQRQHTPQKMRMQKSSESEQPLSCPGSDFRREKEYACLCLHAVYQRCRKIEDSPFEVLDVLG